MPLYGKVNLGTGKKFSRVFCSFINFLNVNIVDHISTAIKRKIDIPDMAVITIERRQFLIQKMKNHIRKTNANGQNNSHNDENYPHLFFSSSIFTRVSRH